MRVNCREWTHTLHFVIIDEKTCPNPEDVIDLADLESADGSVLVKVQV